MDTFNIAELNRWVLLILMFVTIFWIYRAIFLKEKEIEIAKATLENKKLEKESIEKEIVGQDYVIKIRKQQLGKINEQ